MDKPLSRNEAIEQSAKALIAGVDDYEYFLVQNLERAFALPKDEISLDQARAVCEANGFEVRPKPTELETALAGLHKYLLDGAMEQDCSSKKSL